MRAKTIEYIYQKGIIDIVDSGTLTVDTTNSYAAGDYLHDGVIVWNNIFPELVDSFIHLEKIEVFEEIRGTGSLVKPAFDLYIFNNCKAQPSVSKNNPFVYSDIFSDTYPMENNLVKVSFQTNDWFEHTEASNNIADAKAVKKVDFYFRSNNSQHLFGIAVATGATNPFASSARFKIVLWVTLL
jgi:hypothetical protein